ncbi:hypothetical protein DM02DRAFT_621063, partial [Periconia macrospinosa]
MSSGQSNSSSNTSNSSAQETSQANGTPHGNSQRPQNSSRVSDLPSAYVTSLPTEDRGVDLRPFMNNSGGGNVNGSD